MAKIEHDVLTQEFRRPVIYLDHWAVMRLAENHAQRFVDAVHSASATVLLTMGMLMEFHAVLSEQTAQAVERLLNLLMPHIFVSNPALMGRGEEAFPATDLRLLAYIALCPRPLDVTGLIHAAPLAEQRYKDAFSTFCNTVAASIASERSKPDIVDRARTWKPDMSQPLSSNLLRGLKRQAFLDPNAKFDANDSSDLVHALHAAQYSDYALLDGKWADRVRQMVVHVSAHGLQVPQPRIYSERKGGLVHFLEELEAGNAAEPIVAYRFAMGISEVGQLHVPVVPNALPGAIPPGS